MDTWKDFLSAPLEKISLSPFKVLTQMIDQLAYFIDVIILFLIASYTNKSPIFTFSFTLLLAAFFGSAAMGLIPVEQLQMLQTSTIFIFSASKIPQILTNFSVCLLLN